MSWIHPQQQLKRYKYNTLESHFLSFLFIFLCLWHWRSSLHEIWLYCCGELHGLLNQLPHYMYPRDSGKPIRIQGIWYCGGGFSVNVTIVVTFSSAQEGEVWEFTIIPCNRISFNIARKFLLLLSVPKSVNSFHQVLLLLHSPYDIIGFILKYLPVHFTVPTDCKLLPFLLLYEDFLNPFGSLWATRTTVIIIISITHTFSLCSPSPNSL